MKKEKADLEHLLNSLIEKGWKPFGDNAIKFDYDGMKTRGGYGAITYLYRDSYIDDYGDEVEYEEWKHQFNNRELVSKESGLWQFVCENGMVKGNGQYESSAWIRAYEDERDSEEYTSEYGASTAEFYLLESSLKDESELEEFLLSNIKVDDNREYNRFSKFNYTNNN